MDMSTLFIGMFAGAIGVGFIVYGRKQQRVVPFVAGLLLCVVPYFIEQPWLNAAACVVLVASPFVFRL